MHNHLLIECVGGPYCGDLVPVMVGQGVVVIDGHRYRIARDDEGAYILVYVGELVPA